MTPESFQFKLKEALTLNNIDYEKLKTILKDPAIRPSEAWIENEKDKRFQSLFESLWPNLYKNLEEKKAAEAAEAHKQKYVCSLLIDQEVKKYEELLKSKLALSQTAPSAVTSSYPLSTCFSSTKLSATPTFTTTITTTTCKCAGCTPTPSHSEPSTTIKYPNHLSSYDFPYNTRKYVDDIVKSSYNSECLSRETELLKSIRESQDKLKLTQKLEKTTDIVDDIITKVGALQTEMKKKSSEIKLKEEIIKRNKEYDEMQKLLELKRSLTSYDFGKTSNEHVFHHHHCHDNHKQHRSKSREIIVHDCSRSRPTSRSSSCERHRSSSSTGHRHRSRSKSKSRMLRQSIRLVEPKVKCWNYNCKHDENIY